MSDDTRLTAANLLPPELSATRIDAASAATPRAKTKVKRSKRETPEPLPFRPMTDDELAAHERRMAKLAGIASPFGTDASALARNVPVINGKARPVSIATAMTQGETAEAIANSARFDGSARRPDQDNLTKAVERAQKMLRDGKYDVVTGADKVPPVMPNRAARRAHLQRPTANVSEPLVRGRTSGPSILAPWQDHPTSAESAKRTNGASDDVRGAIQPHREFKDTYAATHGVARTDMSGATESAWAALAETRGTVDPADYYVTDGSEIPLPVATCGPDCPIPLIHARTGAVCRFT